jgi:DNA-binding winged helix-turn-helix (wHTH) protein/WD40 repeat protein
VSRARAAFFLAEEAAAPHIDLNMSGEVETQDLGQISFRLGEWLVEPSLNRLTRSDTTIQLELKVMDVLVCLAERAGEVVPRQEIVDRVWATEFISDNTLTHAITEIRNALGDDARNPSFIETIHRRGYRLIAPVEPALPDKAAKSKVARFPVPEGREIPDEGRSPYPGLAAFTEADAEFFFGREDEVARMWRRLTSRRLLALIGPSGVGKSSFLRAGVIPARPDGWGVAICQPGEAPFPSLARALVPEFAGDVDAMAQLVDIRSGDRAVAIVSRWRDRHQQALLIIDQFEELFTLNAEEEQVLFADLLGRLVTDWDVHVLLSMRDDFLYLRRALVEPAGRLGFSLEDDRLPGEMIAEVEGERGALPLLAFAVARLWDARDRGRKLLTRAAYEDIGGVGGALGQHADTTLKAIGDEGLPIVRELFRNLVTAEGTRAVRGWNELLSVFESRKTAVGEGFTPARQSAEDVLRRLIDARLLTSFEEETVEGDGRRRVEVVHETLLSSWPRLVRWQTQDADAAQLRDQLRQAARTWDEHDRSHDMLWTGSAYREFVSWRERYPGGLTETEEAFVAAMTAHAGRRRRRRRILAASVLFVAAVVAAVTTTLWRRSVLEARRAEAAKLLALAQVQIETGPTEALAYATASLELADTNEGRIFALRSLWPGPPLRALNLQETIDNQFMYPTFSPDGRWLAVAGLGSEYVLVYGEHGGEPIALGGHEVPNAIPCSWGRDGLLVTGQQREGRARVWEIPSGRLIREIQLGGEATWLVRHDRLMAVFWHSDPRTGHEMLRIRSWGLRNGGPSDLGGLDWTALGAYDGHFDPRGDAWIYSKGDSVYSRPLPLTAAGPDTVIARHSAGDVGFPNWRRGEGLCSNDAGGEMILWTTEAGTSVPGRRLRRPETATTRLFPDPTGRWAVDDPWAETRVRLWDLAGLAGARPLELLRSAPWYSSTTGFHPHGDWLVATTNSLTEVSFWPLGQPFPTVVEGYENLYRRPVAFTPDGRYLVTHWGQDRVRLWPVPGDERARFVDLMLPREISPRFGLTIDPRGEDVLSVGAGDGIFVLSIDGAEPRRLGGLAGIVEEGAFSPSGRLVAAADNFVPTQATLRVWDLETGEVRAFDQPKDPEGRDAYYAHDLSFADETTLYTAGANGLLRWDLKTGSFEEALKAPPDGFVRMSMTPDGVQMLTYEEGVPRVRIRGSVKLHDLNTGQVRSLVVPGTGCLELSPDGTVWVSGEPDGTIQVGRTDGGHVHLLAGRVGPGEGIAVSPDNRWIASSGDDKTLRLSPMPDLSKPPLHTLPHDELIAKLHSLTNLRVVRDEDAPSGWKLEVGPFPGWETVPTW